MCQKAGLSQELANNLIGQIGTMEVKEELKRSTQEALDLGVREGGGAGEMHAWRVGGAGVMHAWRRAGLVRCMHGGGGWGWCDACMEGVGLV